MALTEEEEAKQKQLKLKFLFKVKKNNKILLRQICKRKRFILQRCISTITIVIYFKIFHFWFYFSCALLHLLTLIIHGFFVVIQVSLLLCCAVFSISSSSSSSSLSFSVDLKKKLLVHLVRHKIISIVCS